MTFGAPLWLLIGALALGLAVLAQRAADRRRRRDLEQFATENILPDLTATLSDPRRRSKRGLVLGGAALCFVALAGPEIGFDWEETERRGIDVLIAVDVSRSMLARDIQPDRLRRAKLAVDDLVERLGGDRLGLIAFAGTAFLQCPLTLDHAAFDRALAAIEPGIISAPGSNLASALDVARKALESEARNVKLLILVSDGEDLRGGALAAAERAAEDGIHVYTVGVGTPAGELIPIPDDPGGAFVKDESGRIVKSRLDEATLKEVAEITDGFYVPLGPRAEGIDELVERALAPIPREELASRLRRIPRNRYQWPLALGILLLAIEPFVNERRRRRSRPAGDGSSVTRAFLFGALLAAASSAHAASSDDAATLYESESYEDAAEVYRELTEEDDDPRLDLNLGMSSYRAGAFPEAARAFARTLRTEDESLRERAFFEMGNAQYRIGQATLESEPQSTIAAWEQAIAAYDEALGLDESDEDARFNRDFVQKKLDELQQQQDQEQDQDQDQQEDQDQQQDQDQQEDQDQQQDQDQQENQDQQQEQDQQEDQDQQQDQDQEEDQQDDQQQDEEEQEDEQPQDPGDEQEDEQPQDPGDEQEDEQPQDPGDEQEEAPPPGTGDDADGAPPPPGQLSPEEARDLLDSLKGDEEFMPMIPMAPAESSDDPRDW